MSIVYFSTKLQNCIESCIQQKMQEKCMCKCDGQQDNSGSGVTILSLHAACHISILDITVKHLVSNQLDHYIIGINYPG